MCARKDEADFVRGQLHVPPGMEAAKTVFCHKRTPLNTNRQRSTAQVQRPRSLAQSQQLMSASTLAEAGEGRGGRRKESRGAVQRLRVPFLRARAALRAPATFVRSRRPRPPPRRRARSRTLCLLDIVLISLLAAAWTQDI